MPFRAMRNGFLLQKGWFHSTIRRLIEHALSHQTRVHPIRSWPWPVPMTLTAHVPASKRAFDWVDLGVLVALGALIYGVVAVAKEWTGHLEPATEIHLEARYLPLYTLFSLTRGVVAYLVSLLFTLVYGYVAARVSGTERVMLPLLDILQSIPVLGFLPGFVLGLVHLFPHQNIGLEIASVLMIFTGQAWNMTYSLYGSLRTVPEDLRAVAEIAKLSWWQRFFRLDLSYSATGLVWNSMMSMAGGWFFLTVSEAFVLSHHDFRLPGLGSYMSVAIEQGDNRAQVLGVLAMLAMIVFLDQLIWRPLLAWSQKFSSEESDRSGVADSWLWDMFRGSQLWRMAARVTAWLTARSRPAVLPPAPASLGPRRPGFLRFFQRALLGLLLAGVLYALLKYLRLLHDLTLTEWGHILESTGLTFFRVVTAVALASLWTVPVGVMIGASPRLTRRLQPVIQMVASFPAPMIFPLVVGLVLSLGGGLGIGSILLLTLATQWYILFNVIAGSSSIPRELGEVARLSRLSWLVRWRRLILPAIFPSLLTGWITAMGGAWNASIVAEYMRYKGATLSTPGLGALISQATDQGEFHLLAAAVGVMSLVVVGFSRLVWRPLSVLAETRYAMNT